MAAFELHHTVSRWFRDRLGEPTAPQREAWPRIAAGADTLIAAPTGSGKTLAAFLIALDRLLRQGDALPQSCDDGATQVLYLSPLKALSNDVRINLLQPLAELRAQDPALPDLRVAVRTGDTPQSQRAAMLRTPPHVLVTTPESLYLLLTGAGGQRMLQSIRTVIVDEIHALARDKRGAHLALSLERLDRLCRDAGRPVPQRIGLSATQRPIGEIASFLVGAGRDCAIVDAGHLRELDLQLEVPPSPLDTVCSHETWDEIYGRMVELIEAHRTTLVFTNTRKLAERIAARLTDLLGDDRVTSHHGSLSKERRLDAERRLKAGELRALVATASLELGIDVGDVDLVIQVGVPATIATLLQRVGRAGHGVDRTPRGRLFPLTRDELVTGAALLRAVRRRDLDRTLQPRAPLDILAQQVVAACVQHEWEEDALFELVRRAWPYRALDRADFDAAVALHTGGRLALLHRDGVNRRLLATKRAKIPALTSGGAIPDRADYRVVQEPEGTLVGTVDEDFAVESSGGDVFQLGNASWRVLKVEPGVVHVADAQGAPPTLPFWFGEAPARSRELAEHVSAVRGLGRDPARLRDEIGLGEAAAGQIADYLADGERVLGAIPTTRRVVLERFFDESGGMQLVLHAPFGGRINRAFGLALRKRFCRGFGFELQAAANEEAIVLSLGPQHSFPLLEVLDYLRPATVREVLTQALLAAPMFETRWRWNVTRSLVVPKSRGGRPLPAPILRMRADDELARAFPEVRACGENLPPGDLPVPLDHPLVRQTVDDCLTEAMDVDGLIAVLEGLRDGTIERTAVDTPEPSAFARGILNAQPYAFLDDAPLEERRTQAVLTRRGLSPREQDELGALDPAAVQRVREEAWPQPQSAEEVHEALLWMGFVTPAEAPSWCAWLAELAAAGRVVADGERWFAVEATREPLDVLRGRLEALGPVFADEPDGGSDDGLYRRLEASGDVLRIRLDGRAGWCNRRLLARIHRYTLDSLREQIQPATASELLRFLAAWQHADPAHRATGIAGLAEVIDQLSGLDVPAAAWEREVLPQRVEGYRRDWLDQLTLSGEVAWGRLWGRSATAVRNTPMSLMPRRHLAEWLALAEPPGPVSDGPATMLLGLLRERGALFPTDLRHASGLLPSYFERGLGELVARGLATCDSFAALRQLVVPPSKRRRDGLPFGVGRWSLLRGAAPAAAESDGEARAAFVLDRLLRRYGVVFHQLLLREKQPIPWRDLLRLCRRRELRGEIRGGRFVARFSGEQFALPEAVELLRKLRRAGSTGGAAELPGSEASGFGTDRSAAARGRAPCKPIEVSAADPLNLRGILTPDPRVSPLTHHRVLVG